MTKTQKNEDINNTNTGQNTITFTNSPLINLGVPQNNSLVRSQFGNVNQPAQSRPDGRAKTTMLASKWGNNFNPDFDNNVNQYIQQYYSNNPSQAPSSEDLKTYKRIFNHLSDLGVSDEDILDDSKSQEHIRKLNGRFKRGNKFNQDSASLKEFIQSGKFSNISKVAKENQPKTQNLGDVNNPNEVLNPKSSGEIVGNTPSLQNIEDNSNVDWSKKNMRVVNRGVNFRNKFSDPLLQDLDNAVHGRPPVEKTDAELDTLVANNSFPPNLTQKNTANKVAGDQESVKKDEGGKTSKPVKLSKEDSKIFKAFKKFLSGATRAATGSGTNLTNKSDKFKEKSSSSNEPFTNTSKSSNKKDQLRMSGSTDAEVENQETVTGKPFGRPPGTTRKTYVPLIQQQRAEEEAKRKSRNVSQEVRDKRAENARKMGLSRRKSDPSPETEFSKALEQQRVDNQPETSSRVKDQDYPGLMSNKESQNLMSLLNANRVKREQKTASRLPPGHVLASQNSSPTKEVNKSSTTKNTPDVFTPSANNITSAQYVANHLKKLKQQSESQTAQITKASQPGAASTYSPTAVNPEVLPGQLSRKGSSKSPKGIGSSATDIYASSETTNLKGSKNVVGSLPTSTSTELLGGELGKNKETDKKQKSLDQSPINVYASTETTNLNPSFNNVAGSFEYTPYVETLAGDLAKNEKDNTKKSSLNSGVIDTDGTFDGSNTLYTKGSTKALPGTTSSIAAPSSPKTVKAEPTFPISSEDKSIKPEELQSATIDTLGVRAKSESLKPTETIPYINAGVEQEQDQAQNNLVAPSKTETQTKSLKASRLRRTKSESNISNGTIITPTDSYKKPFATDRHLDALNLGSTNDLTIQDKQRALDSGRNRQEQGKKVGRNILPTPYTAPPKAVSSSTVKAPSSPKGNTQEENSKTLADVNSFDELGGVIVSGVKKAAQPLINAFNKNNQKRVENVNEIKKRLEVERLKNEALEKKKQERLEFLEKEKQRINNNQRVTKPLNLGPNDQNAVTRAEINRKRVQNSNAPAVPVNDKVERDYPPITINPSEPQTETGGGMDGDGNGGKGKIKVAAAAIPDPENNNSNDEKMSFDFAKSNLDRILKNSPTDLGVDFNDPANGIDLPITLGNDRPLTPEEQEKNDKERKIFRRMGEFYKTQKPDINPQTQKAIDSVTPTGRARIPEPPNQHRNATGSERDQRYADYYSLREIVANSPQQGAESVMRNQAFEFNSHDPSNAKFTGGEIVPHKTAKSSEYNRITPSGKSATAAMNNLRQVRSDVPIGNYNPLNQSTTNKNTSQSSLKTDDEPVELDSNGTYQFNIPGLIKIALDQSSEPKEFGKVFKHFSPYSNRKEFEKLYDGVLVDSETKEKHWKYLQSAFSHDKNTSENQQDLVGSSSNSMPKRIEYATSVAGGSGSGGSGNNRTSVPAGSPGDRGRKGYGSSSTQAIQNTNNQVTGTESTTYTIGQTEFNRIKDRFENGDFGRSGNNGQQNLPIPIIPSREEPEVRNSQTDELHNNSKPSSPRQKTKAISAYNPLTNNEVQRSKVINPQVSEEEKEFDKSMRERLAKLKSPTGFKKSEVSDYDFERDDPNLASRLSLLRRNTTEQKPIDKKDVFKDYTSKGSKNDDIEKEYNDYMRLIQSMGEPEIKNDFINNLHAYEPVETRNVRYGVFEPEQGPEPETDFIPPSPPENPTVVTTATSPEPRPKQGIFTTYSEDGRDIPERVANRAKHHFTPRFGNSRNNQWEEFSGVGRNPGNTSQNSQSSSKNDTPSTKKSVTIAKQPSVSTTPPPPVSTTPKGRQYNTNQGGEYYTNVETLNLLKQGRKHIKKNQEIRDAVGYKKAGFDKFTVDKDKMYSYMKGIEEKGANNGLSQQDRSTYAYLRNLEMVRHKAQDIDTPLQLQDLPSTKTRRMTNLEYQLRKKYDDKIPYSKTRLYANTEDEKYMRNPSQPMRDIQPDQKTNAYTTDQVPTEKPLTMPKLNLSNIHPLKKKSDENSVIPPVTTTVKPSEPTGVPAKGLGTINLNDGGDLYRKNTTILKDVKGVKNLNPKSFSGISLSNIPITPRTHSALSLHHKEEQDLFTRNGGSARITLPEDKQKKQFKKVPPHVSTTQVQPQQPVASQPTNQKANSLERRSKSTDSALRQNLGLGNPARRSVVRPTSLNEIGSETRNSRQSSIDSTARSLSSSGSDNNFSGRELTRSPNSRLVNIPTELTGDARPQRLEAQDGQFSSASNSSSGSSTPRGSRNITPIRNRSSSNEIRPATPIQTNSVANMIQRFGG